MTKPLQPLCHPFVKAADVPDDLDIVIFALPSFTHELYLKALKPYLKQGVTIGAMPAEGGFDLCAIHNLGSEFVRNSNLFSLETMPYPGIRKES